MTRRGEQAAVGRERAEARFERLYAEHGRAVLAYAVRRATGAQDAADVVAETFLVAWRRLDDVPPADEARLWLYGVARHVLANQHRSERRRERLAERLRRELPDALDTVPPVGPDAAVVRAGLAQLGADDQEILRLSGWEELNPREIATVLGISHVAARSRLHRARHRLRAALRDVTDDDVSSEDASALCLQEAR
jgi:RNA polymerase sigma-70 factor (ECF subfamily)